LQLTSCSHSLFIGIIAAHAASDRETSRRKKEKLLRYAAVARGLSYQTGPSKVRCCLEVIRVYHGQRSDSPLSSNTTEWLFLPAWPFFRGTSLHAARRCVRTQRAADLRARGDQQVERCACCGPIQQHFCLNARNRRNADDCQLFPVRVVADLKSDSIP
jgi:hypothetical protein